MKPDNLAFPPSEPADQPPAPEPSSGPPKTAGGPTNGQVLLGLFIAWQIIFLLAANYLRLIQGMEGYLPDDEKSKAVEHLTLDLAQGKGHVNDAASLFNRWEDLTGQYQNWCLFAPGVTRNLTFVAVKFRWDEDPASLTALSRPLAELAAARPIHAVALLAAIRSAGARPPASGPRLLLSENEPPDITSFLRGGLFRIRKYENVLELNLRVIEEEGETTAEAHQRWRRAIKKKVREEWDTIQAYCEGRWRAFKKTHPDFPRPTQMILLVRRYHIPPPDQRPWKWQGPYQVPVARWQVDVHEEDDYLPVEMYDPVARRFVFVPRKKGP